MKREMENQIILAKEKDLDDQFFIWSIIVSTSMFREIVVFALNTIGEVYFDMNNFIFVQLVQCYRAELEGKAFKLTKKRNKKKKKNEKLTVVAYHSP